MRSTDGIAAVSFSMFFNMGDNSQFVSCIGDKSFLLDGQMGDNILVSYNIWQGYNFSITGCCDTEVIKTDNKF